MVGNSIGLDRLHASVSSRRISSPNGRTTRRASVDQVMGAFFLVRRSVFEALGGFDERFFVYYEDLDFAVRARAHGWSSVYIATAQAFHRGQGTTEGATARRTFYFCRSRILYARKHFSMPGAFAVMAATLTLEPFARLAAAPRSARQHAARVRDAVARPARDSARRTALRPDRQEPSPASSRRILVAEIDSVASSRTSRSTV